MQPEAIGQAGQIVEDTNDVRDLQAALVIKSQFTQRLPVFLDHAGWRGTEFLRQGTQRPVAWRKVGYFSPAFLFDRFNESRIAVLDAQKLCVRLGSVVAILRSRRYGSDHFALTPAQAAFGSPHDLVH